MTTRESRPDLAIGAAPESTATDYGQSTVFTFRDVLAIRDRWLGPDWKPAPPDPFGWPKYSEDEQRICARVRAAEWALEGASRAAAEDILDESRCRAADELLPLWRLHGTHIARLDAELRRLNAAGVVA